jgi:hypothetical protein
MAKKNSRSDNSASTNAATERRRTPRATTRTSGTTPAASIAEPDGSPAVVRDTADDMPPQVSDSTSAPTYEQIAEAAYQRYLQRGGQHGQDFDDWLEAERSLRGRK